MTRDFLYKLPLILLKLSKFAKLTYLVKLFKSVKVLKVLLSFGTMLISLFSYSLVLSPWFAVGFLLLLFIHEMGHVVALKQKGHPASLPVFIPFMGALIFSPRFDERNTEAYVGIGGPILGTIGALFFYILWLFHPENTILLILSFYGCVINLFNLIPISPFDGGRILQAVSDKTRYLGGLILLYLVCIMQEPGLLLIGILSLDEFRYSLYQKVRIGIFIQLIMMILMAIGYGNQSLYLNLFDVAIVSIVNGVRFGVLNSRIKLFKNLNRLYNSIKNLNDSLGQNAPPWEEKENLEKHLEDSRQDIYGVSFNEKPILSLNHRFKWLCAYLALAALLITSITIQTNLIDMTKIQQTIERKS